MFEEFDSFTITTQANPPVSIFGRISKNADSPLPPILMLHGFPQSHHIWHKITPQLVQRYTIVLMDLRGYGASSKPDDLRDFAKGTMARDCIGVMDSLDLTGSFFVCGHDRGARVAHKLCVDYPARVQKAMLLDICPTLAMYTSTNQQFATAYFHWFFLIQPEPLPETLINACARKFGEFCLGIENEGDLPAFDKECAEHYLATLEDPMAVHSMCQDYRAGASLDMDEARDDMEQGRLIQCPLRLLWAKAGVIEKCFDPIREWQAVTKGGVEVSGYSVDAGHFIPEAVPDVVVSNIVDFFT